ncbi:MAG: hypothetical protein H6738_09525 [Alphaproteobacteria bacterium]|nr:hypothetical protein [Alphaproteobacteria bacterium]
MLLTLMSIAQAVEPCTQAYARPHASSDVQVAWLGMPDDPTQRVFVVNRDIAAAVQQAGKVTVTTDAIPITRLPGGQRTETALLLGGATRPRGAAWRLGGASPRFYLDGVALTSNLE